MILSNIHDSQVIVCLGLETPVRAFRPGRARPVTLTIPPGGFVDVGRALGLDEAAATHAVEHSRDCLEMIRKGYLRQGIYRADVTRRTQVTPAAVAAAVQAVKAVVDVAVADLPPAPTMTQQVEAEVGAPVVLTEPSMDWTKQDLLAWAKSRGVDVNSTESKASIYRKIIGA